MDYELLKLVWWALIGVLLVGFAITDGFDMGAGAMLPFVGRTDLERRVAINALGPHWDGNQVWFITAGGALFAAWPMVYAVAFSGFYWAMMLVLFALFFRPVGFEYRSKVKDDRWRRAWDWGIFAGSAIPALVFGVAIGNLFLGVPFELDNLMRSRYDGGLFGLLNPFALLCGVVSLSMLMLHGGNYLQLRTDGAVAERARRIGQLAGLVAISSFVLAGLWLKLGMAGYVIQAMGEPGAVLVPTAKEVSLVPGAWLANYEHFPLLWLAPAVGLAGMALSVLLGSARRPGWGFTYSALACAGVIFTAGGSLFPFVLTSSLSPNHSLTLWDAVSSEKTLGIMLVVAIIFVPIVLGYTLWCYRKMWGRVTEQHIKQNSVGSY
ncbi:cytochrome d ubiquinol oxidase subunit II [Oceanimonas sp. CAM02]|uniref:cytochrome d ubiquinol oxidase subunit II n=1 Tax=Oceanimonas sp. CAM02 TaxID=3080336 RepID=UPI0029367D3B|nr:cytochrome d ubiquinol oxidase subunit II [Oceanimonas sp. CAM02]MDV2857748.1 cytochrome d ubiquinol oxidase subunit II [Oceanimonas sp. CAM02]